MTSYIYASKYNEDIKMFLIVLFYFNCTQLLKPAWFYAFPRTFKNSTTNHNNTDV